MLQKHTAHTNIKPTYYSLEQQEYRLLTFIAIYYLFWQKKTTNGGNFKGTRIYI